MATLEHVRSVTAHLPRAYEAVVRDRVKWRVGRLVFLAASRDETMLGFAFPKEERAALVQSDAARFLLPTAGDLRYNWAVLRLAAFEPDELGELIVDAWRMCVPKSVAAAFDVLNDAGRGTRGSGADPLPSPGGW